ncbi:MAG: methyltransferase domain-containing protein [Planctomycetota bacterium]
MDADYTAAYERLYHSHWWWQCREEYLLHVLRRHRVPVDAGVLDVGCGGGWAFPIWERFGDVRGVEIDPFLAQSNESTRERIHIGPLDRAFAPGMSFGLIVMLDVLEHIDEPLPVLSRASELLAESGQLLITVPAHPSAWTHHDEVNHHRRRYTKRTLLEEVSGVGFELLELRYFFHALVPLKWLVRCKESLLSPAASAPSVPGKTVNGLMGWFFRWEQRWVTPLGLPFGTSLMAVCKKKTTQAE